MFFLIPRWTAGFGQHPRGCQVPDSATEPFQPCSWGSPKTDITVSYLLYSQRKQGHKVGASALNSSNALPSLSSRHLLSSTEKKKFGQKMLLGILFIENSQGQVGVPRWSSDKLSYSNLYRCWGPSGEAKGPEENYRGFQDRKSPRHFSRRAQSLCRVSHPFWSLSQRLLTKSLGIIQ